jgi:lipid-binding SYLF domain-containing protein
MKTLMLGLILLGFAGGALAVDSAELDTRIQNLTSLFQVMQGKPELAVPPEVLRDAKGLVLLDVTKAGFGFAYQHGAGVAMVRDAASGKWSAPGFIEANTASIGPQAGGQQVFLVIVFKTTNSVYALTQPNFAPGGEAGVTAGYKGAGVQGSAARTARDVEYYADRNGFFGGADFKFGGISPDDNANTIYYEKSVTMSDILFSHSVSRSPAAQDLTKTIEESAKAEKTP